MRKDNIVQFVCFETRLNSDQFLMQWENFKRSANSDLDVVLQQSEKNGVHRYIAQHYCSPGELNFAFTKGKKSSHSPEPGIKTKQAGGYSILQGEKKDEANPRESKIFVFITDALANLDSYRKLTAHSKLNIYQPYYENCSYAYILEFFVKDVNTTALQQQLKLYDVADVHVYKEMLMTV